MDPVSMRLICLGCELENNKPEFCSVSRAKMKKLCTTKNEKAHDSLHFPGSAPGWLLITDVVKEAQQLSSWKQTGHMSQHRHLPASSPSAFLNQHHSKFPAQKGFPSLSATGASTQPKTWQSESVPSPQEWSRKPIISPGANTSACLWNFNSCMEKTWKSRSFPCSFPERWIKPLNSIFSWHHNGRSARVEKPGKSEMQPTSCLGCMCVTQQAVRGKISICAKQEPPPLLARMCSCGTARLWASRVSGGEIKILSLSSRLQQGFLTK